MECFAEVGRVALEMHKRAVESKVLFVWSLDYFTYMHTGWTYRSSPTG
jgi:hypothetical protein